MPPDFEIEKCNNEKSISILELDNKLYLFKINMDSI